MLKRLNYTATVTGCVLAFHVLQIISAQGCGMNWQLPKIGPFPEGGFDDLVDTLGLVLSVVVHSAGLQDRGGAKLLLPALLRFGWVRKVFADGGYAGQLLHWVRLLIPGRGLQLEIIKRTDSGFKILPKRWVVERTFAWLGRYRRLAKDYERRIDHSEAAIYIASSKLMLGMLANYVLLGLFGHALRGTSEDRPILHFEPETRKSFD